jgi:hypothetical protein
LCGICASRLSPVAINPGKRTSKEGSKQTLKY